MPIFVVAKLAGSHADAAPPVTELSDQSSAIIGMERKARFEVSSKGCGSRLYQGFSSLPAFQLAQRVSFFWSRVPVLPTHGQPEPRSPPWSSRRELEAHLRGTNHGEKTNFSRGEWP